jgi:hypothetical protein
MKVTESPAFHHFVCVPVTSQPLAAIPRYNCSFIVLAVGIGGGTAAVHPYVHSSLRMLDFSMSFYATVP